MKRFFSILIIIASLSAIGQKVSVKELSTFPEDYLGKTITFKNVWWYPTLSNKKNNLDGITYYQVQLGVTDKYGNLTSFEMGGMAKIQSVVKKSFAKKLTTDGKNGYEKNYFGDVTGKVIKAKTFSSSYFFLISKIVYHNPDGSIITTYTN